MPLLLSDLLSLLLRGIGTRSSSSWLYEASVSTYRWCDDGCFSLARFIYRCNQPYAASIRIISEMIVDVTRETHDPLHKRGSRTRERVRISSPLAIVVAFTHYLVVCWPESSKGNKNQSVHCYAENTMMRTSSYYFSWIVSVSMMMER